MQNTIVEKLKLKGFLRDYINYARELTDAPLEFHLGAGLTLLSTCAGAKITYPGWGGQKCWPNLYCLLIAPSGLYRKSTALGIAERLLKEIDPALLLEGEQSREKFLNILQQSSCLLYPISELSAVLAVWNKDYSSGFREIITDLYDKNEYKRSLQSGVAVIKGLSLNILAASTIDWLRIKLTESDLFGGFMARFLLIPGVKKEPDKGLTIDFHDEEKNYLKLELKDIINAKIHIDISKYLTEYNNWSKMMNRRMEKSLNPELLGFQSRLPAHCLKLAILFTISEVAINEHMDLDSDCLSKAMIFSQWILEHSMHIAETGFTRNKIEHQIQKVITMARNNGGVEHTLALRALHVSKYEFESIIKTAIERKNIIPEQKQEDGHKIKTIYRNLKDIEPEIKGEDTNETNTIREV